MDIIPKLKTLFEGKFDNILNEGRFSLFDFSKNKKTVIEIKGENKLGIDLSKASSEEKRKIKEVIIDALIEEDEAILTDDTSNKTKQIKSSLPSGDDEKLLIFYKDKLKPDMYKALEASLVVRNSFGKNENITELKKDISRRYPLFGRNLCNMTNQGYFHGHFKELYDSMIEDDDFDINTYQEKVEKHVKALPYTVFISQQKTFNELSGEVAFKLEKLMKYGTGRLLIHGLSKVNVKTVLKILEEYEDNDDVTIAIDINPKKTYITATLKF